MDRTELFLLAEGEDLKYYIDGARLYKKYTELKAKLNASKPKEIPQGKKLIFDPFAGYILINE